MVIGTIVGFKFSEIKFLIAVTFGSNYCLFSLTRNKRLSNCCWSKKIEYLIANLLGCLGPIVLPILQLYVLYQFWPQYTRRVDRRYCTCSCWDTVFKGSYESGIASYKHIYFNATSNTAKIWVLTVICVLALYESLKHVSRLLLRQRLRLSMLILFLSSVFSHYYSWWSFFNYWNDEFYLQWYHQLFFSLSELVSTCLVLRLADLQTPVTPFTVLPIIVVATVHVVVASLDQFVVNVVDNQGSTHQIMRDVGFMVPDILHILVPLCELLCMCRLSCSLRRDCLMLCSNLVSVLHNRFYRK